jgi:biotin carboxyl carrier protein
MHTASVAHPFSPVFDSAIFPQLDQVIEKIRNLLHGGASTTPRSLRPTDTAASGMPFAQNGPGSQPTVIPESLKTGTPDRPTLEPPSPPSIEGPGEPDPRIAVTIPNQGLTVDSARIVRWLVEVGDTVREGQALYEIETDKIVMEVEAETDGVVDEILHPADTSLPLGARVAWLTAPVTTARR